MAYKKIKVQNMTEVELRQLWKEEYCNRSQPISTYDGIVVFFYESLFDHAFFESQNRKKGDKSILSLNRLEKMLWIKEVLQDPSALLKQGWDKTSKRYDNSRRVAFVKGNYVVVIRFTGISKASFVTAYEMQDTTNIQKVLSSPDWVKDKRYFPEESEEAKEGKKNGR